MRTPTLFTALSTLLFASCYLHNPSTTKIHDLRGSLSHCPVHKEALVEATQRVNDSRVSHHPLYWQIRDALFPAAFTPSDEGDLAWVTYCRSCRVAKALFENDEASDALFSRFPNPNDDASRAQHNREVDAFIERQRQQLNQAMSLPKE
jgi:hypothetical protein